MAAGSVDAVVTDPPYGLEFMGKEWDTHAGPREFQEWCEAWAREALRALKPGGHLLAFGGTRTYHRLACAIEDAGFEIRDCLAWLYGSGFPKSLDVSKAIDKAAGVEWTEFTANPAERPGNGDAATTSTGWAKPSRPPKPVVESDEAKVWDGWGTALKPAHEPVVVARKPLAGTVAANVLAHGTGALNIDGCRIEGAAGDGNWAGATEARGYDGGWDGTEKPNVEQNPQGRWPANVALDPEAAAMLDAQSGEQRDGVAVNRNRSADNVTSWFGTRSPLVGDDVGYGGGGGASRFFYVAKAGSRERNAGLDGFPERTTRDTYGDGLQGPRPHTADDYEWQRKGARNVHPTVKPIELMRWLVRLVTPPGGLVLDPFMGSGTTGIACALEGMEFYGIERKAEYLRIAEARIAWWSRHRGEGETGAILDAAGARDAAAAHGQLDLLGEA